MVDRIRKNRSVPGREAEGELGGSSLLPLTLSSSRVSRETERERVPVWPCAHERRVPRAARETQLTQAQATPTGTAVKGTDTHTVMYGIICFVLGNLNY